MKKYIKLKVFKGEIYLWAVSLAFAIHGNQFCLLPCIRWKADAGEGVKEWNGRTTHSL